MTTTAAAAAPSATPRGAPRPPAGAAVLQADVTAAITRAAFREWAHTGYAGLAMETVARRAGVGKAALYRRWPSKAAMVAHLLERAGAPPAEVPDLGSFRAEVRAFLDVSARLLRRPLVRRIVADLHAEMARSSELAALVRGRLQVARRALARRILDRAVARGEVHPSVDVELVLDLLAAPLYWRLVVTGGACSATDLDRLTSLICGAFAGGSAGTERPTRGP